jgi:ABC-2 type transport system permease protein
MKTLTVFFRSVRDEWTRVLTRAPSVVVILVGLPLFYPLVLSWLYSADSVVERPVAVVDDDRSALSRRIAFDLDATPEAAVVLRPATLDDALRDLEEHRVEMVVWLPPDLSARIAHREQADVRVWVGAANVLTYGIGYPGIVNVVSNLNAEIGRDRLVVAGVAPQAAANRVLPVRTDTRIAFHPTLSYGSFLVPGILLLVVQQLMLIGLALSAGYQREKGNASEGASERPWAWLWGKLAGQAAVHVAGMLFILLVVAPAFGWPFRSTRSVLALFGLFMVATAPMAVLFARFVPDRQAAFQVLMYLTVPLLMASGFAWPRDQMPTWIRDVSSIFPATPALQALRSISMRTGDLGVVRPQLELLGWQAAGWTLLAAFAAGIEAIVRRVSGRVSVPSP